MSFFVVFLSCFNIVLWLIFFIFFKKTFSPNTILIAIRDEVNKLLIEISREADADITLVESRIRSLKAVIDEADKRLFLAQKKAESQDIPQNQKKEAAENVQKKAELDLFDVSISEDAKQKAQNLKSESEKSKKEVAHLEKISVKTQIRELFKTGFTAEQIAERLHISVSEVQLAISLAQ